MTPSAILYAAADYMREHGFSPKLGADGCPRCFIGVMRSVTGLIAVDGWTASDVMLQIIGFDPSARRLIHEGWNTRDAVAALTIAADIAFEDERSRETT